MPYGTVNADLMTTSDGVSSSGLYGFKNRIINGAMVIDQRNAGASVTVNNNQQYAVDRFIIQSSTSTQFTAQQSTTAPTGFYNSLLITTSSANASAFNAVWQRIEANNTNDFGLGAATASTFTVSFWVRSSVTGAFGFYLQNSASSYSYVTTYTINAANTWEYKTITVTGPTAGTWLTTNSCSLQVAWSLGGTGGTTSTLGSWQSANVYNATGSTGISNTASATFYITGVQLEKGSVATSFDYRPYGTELQLCQRYYYPVRGSGQFADVVGTTTTDMFFGATFPVEMRATPTITGVLTALQVNNFTLAYTASGGSYSFGATNTQGVNVRKGGFTSLNTSYRYFVSSTSIVATADAEL